MVFLLRLIVFKLDVKAVLNADLHLYRVVYVWITGQLVNN